MKMEFATEIYNRQKCVERNIDHWETKADDTPVNRNLPWEYLIFEEKLQRNDFNKLSKPGFWSTLRVGDGFKDILKNVIPTFWNNGNTQLCLQKIL